MQVVRGDDHDGIEYARAVRTEVFVDEFAITPDEEFDLLDTAAETVHVVAVDATGAVGTARLVTDPVRAGVVHITRVAVRSRARGSGVGKAMMETLERIAVEEHAVGRPPAVRLELSVMDHAVGFYEALGYSIGADRYPEVRIWHRRAEKTLTS